mmetsp:Transcript_868/g.3189  ORF Transcript_868/g.3189 Transcript_868/m.3189 type:complete len:332 (+) Transcript_868:1754-2749(+)
MAGQELAHDGPQQLLLRKLALRRCKCDTNRRQQLVRKQRHVTLKAGVDDPLERLHDLAAESANVVGTRLSGPLPRAGVAEVVTPEASLGAGDIATSSGVELCELEEAEAPAELRRGEGDIVLQRINQVSFELVVAVLRNLGVHHVNDVMKLAVDLLGLHLQLHEEAVNLVDYQHGLDALLQSLPQDSLSLNADAFDAVDDNECAVSDAQSCRDLAGEVDVAWGVDEVQKYGRLLVDKRQSDAGALDRDSSCCLVLHEVQLAAVACLFVTNEAGRGQQGVGKSRLAVVNVRNDADVANARGLVHELANAVFSGLHHLSQSWGGSYARRNCGS